MMMNQQLEFEDAIVDCLWIACLPIVDRLRLWAFGDNNSIGSQHHEMQRISRSSSNSRQTDNSEKFAEELRPAVPVSLSKLWAAVAFVTTSMRHAWHV